jgi:meso-butanediol dehydrogenase/(S,S)-butanediol dehydrogenase/diacetyl reductase
MRLSGSVAIVTGSTSGIGIAIARRLVVEGASVVVTGRDRERGNAVAAAIDGETPAESSGDRVAFVPADLTDEWACAALVAGAVDRFGSLTILVNNAVATDSGRATVDHLDTADWESALRVNVTAAMWMCRAAIPHLRSAGNGAIVNVSSRAAERASPSLPAYAASKGALNALTRAIAVDHAADGIRCNTVSPGYVLHERRDRDLDPERKAQLEAMHLTRLATGDDVAAAVAFLCSDDAACITGINLPVDGGSTIARASVLG